MTYSARVKFILLAENLTFETVNSMPVFSESWLLKLHV